MCGCADMTPGSELIAVVACKRISGDPDMVMTGTAVDLTDKYDPESTGWRWLRMMVQPSSHALVRDSTILFPEDVLPEHSIL